MRISREQARTWFAQARVGHLASANGAGRPHLVPVVFAVRGEVIVTAVDRKPKRSRQLRRLRNIAENPRVAVLVDHYEDDWSRLWWVRADGEAELAEAETHPELLAALVAKYPQYHEEPPTGPLVVIRVSRWSGWSGAG